MPLSLPPHPHRPLRQTFVPRLQDEEGGEGEGAEGGTQGEGADDELPDDVDLDALADKVGDWGCVPQLSVVGCWIEA